MLCPHIRLSAFLIEELSGGGAQPKSIISTALTRLDPAVSRPQSRREEAADGANIPHPEWLYQDQGLGMPASPQRMEKATASGFLGQAAALTDSQLENHHYDCGGSMPELPGCRGEDPLETYLVQVQLAASFNSRLAEDTGPDHALSREQSASSMVDLQLAEQASWPAIKGLLLHRLGQKGRRCPRPSGLSPPERGWAPMLPTHRLPYLRSQPTRGAPQP